MFVPGLPTLWPAMLLPSHRQQEYFPFCSPTVRYFYFARNAIWLVAQRLGLAHSEVLVPAYHHGVEIEALIDAGAQVKFYRIGPCWELDLEDVASKIGPQTRALYLIHYAGFPSPVHEMRALADRYGLILIEDCALSLLSAADGIALGTTGDIAIYCLYKVLPVPNGGALIINNPTIGDISQLSASIPASTFSHTISSLLQNLALRGGRLGCQVRDWIRRLGKSAVSAAKIERVAIGSQHFNRAHVHLAMSSFTRYIALSQDMAGIVEQRRRNYHYLVEQLNDLAPTLYTTLPKGVSPLFYPLLVKDKDAVLIELARRGIEAIDFWRYFHPNCDATQFPDVARLRKTIVEIPCHQDLSPAMMKRMAAIVQAVLMKLRKR
ncbi:MAG: DegT/DnrJ/EryC1/StrS family aminotransferase [Acidobacteriota bacterium]